MNTKKSFSLIFVIASVMAVTLSGCNKKDVNNNGEVTKEEDVTICGYIEYNTDALNQETTSIENDEVETETLEPWSVYGKTEEEYRADETIALLKLEQSNDGCYKNNTDILEVRWYNSVVPNEAFEGCTNLEKVTFEVEVTSIGDYAFKDCKKLQSVTIPDTVTNIGSGAFYSCESITKVNIPESVSEIKAETFARCKSLQQVYIPWSIKSIGKYAFDNTGLTTIYIPASTKYVGVGAFRNSALTKINIDKATYFDDSSIAGCDGIAITSDRNKTDLIGTLCRIYTEGDNFYLPSNILTDKLESERFLEHFGNITCYDE